MEHRGRYRKGFEVRERRQEPVGEVGGEIPRWSMMWGRQTRIQTRKRVTCCGPVRKEEKGFTRCEGRVLLFLII